MGNITQSAGENVKSDTDVCMKPKCPYYQDSGSELVCPYFMMANNMGPGGMANGSARSNWAGVASLILGIISISMCWLSVLLFPAFIFIVMSVLAIVFGALGMRNGTRFRMGRMAAGAGLVLGILSLIFSIVLMFIRMLSWGYYYG